MHGVGDFLSSGDLVAVPDAGNIGLSARAFRDEGGLADEEGSSNRGSLGVVFWDNWKLNMRFVRAKSGQRCHDHAMVQLEITNSGWLKKTVGRHDGRV
jgi:hypothetical protein